MMADKTGSEQSGPTAGREIIFTCKKCEANYQVEAPTNECPVCSWHAPSPPDRQQDQDETSVLRLGRVLREARRFADPDGDPTALSARVLISQIDAALATPPVSDASRKAIAAISRVVSSRDDLGHEHFVVLSEAVTAALSSETVSDASREAPLLSDLADWCNVERHKLGAVDGYDYRSGEEYGLRRVEIEIGKRLSPAGKTGGEG